MGWYTYFKLLQKYNGDLYKATDDEMHDAALSNPNTPPRALEIAREKYDQEQYQKQTELIYCSICEYGTGVDEAGRLMCTNMKGLGCKIGEARKCSVCGRTLRPGPARCDGEATYVGYLPCPKHPKANG